LTGGSQKEKRMSFEQKLCNSLKFFLKEPVKEQYPDVHHFGH
jgi:hypothetical protein